MKEAKKRKVALQVYAKLNLSSTPQNLMHPQNPLWI
jgi:hypothetical protein